MIANAMINGEENWLSTNAAPAAAPNTGMFFQPQLYWSVNPGNPASNNDYFYFFLDVELVIEV